MRIKNTHFRIFLLLCWFCGCATPIRKEILTLKTYKQQPSAVSFIFERGDVTNLYTDCKLDLSNPDLHFAKLLYPNHINHIWRGILLEPVEIPKAGLTLGINISIVEKHSIPLRLLSLAAMIGTLGLYAPSRTYDTQLSYVLLDFDRPPIDRTSESFRGHVTFTGKYSVYTKTYTKFLLGNLLPYRPDDENCSEIDDELIKSIVEIREEFSKDILRAFP